MGVWYSFRIYELLVWNKKNAKTYECANDYRLRIVRKPNPMFESCNFLKSKSFFHCSPVVPKWGYVKRGDIILKRDSNIKRNLKDQ